MARRRQRISKPKPDPVVTLARTIGLSEAQIANGKFARCDIVNHSDEDHRALARAIGYSTNEAKDSQRQTIRRKPKIDELVKRGVINQREAAACEWYAQAHSLRYDTVGITVRYGMAGGNGCFNFDHLPKSREQEEAYNHFAYAREGINPFFLPMFERIVLYGRPLGKLGISFRTAARELLARIEDRVAL